MVIIANPRAGHGKGTGNVERLRGAIRRRGLDGRVEVTEQPGHATDIARALVESGEHRIAVTSSARYRSIRRASCQNASIRLPLDPGHD